MGKKPERFSDLEPQAFDTELRIPIKDLVEHEIVVHDLQVRDGQFGSWMIVLASEEGSDTLFTLTSGGGVIMRKIGRAKEEGLLPLKGQIVTRPASQSGYADYYDIV